MKQHLLSMAIVPMLVLAGCTDPGSDSSEPTQHSPEALVVPLPDDSNGGGRYMSTSEPPSWFMWVEVLEQTMPAQDAVLELAINVEDQGVEGPFDGEGWIFRLSVNDGHTIHNGTVEPPDDADWYRNFTLQSVRNATTSHPTSFRLGDLDGDKLVLRLDYHNLLPDGSWVALASIIFIEEEAQEDDEDEEEQWYVPRNRPRAALGVCNSVHMGANWSVCPWYEEHGYGPPPDG